MTAVVQTDTKRPMSQRALRFAPIVLALALTACQSHYHRVGSGPSGIGSESVRQYYFLWGLVDLNEVDSQRFTDNAVSYDIVSEFGFADFVYSLLLGPLTVVSRTITVYR